MPDLTPDAVAELRQVLEDWPEGHRTMDFWLARVADLGSMVRPLLPALLAAVEECDRLRVENVRATELWRADIKRLDELALQVVDLEAENARLRERIERLREFV